MSLTKEDKKEFTLLVGEAITDLILPRFDEIDKRFERVETDIKEIKEDVKILKEDVHDLQNTTNRIEIFQRSEINRVDDHEVRLVKLEQAHAK